MKSVPVGCLERGKVGCLGAWELGLCRGVAVCVPCCWSGPDIIGLEFLKQNLRRMAHFVPVGSPSHVAEAPWRCFKNSGSAPISIFAKYSDNDNVQGVCPPSSSNKRFSSSNNDADNCSRSRPH